MDADTDGDTDVDGLVVTDAAPDGDTEAVLDTVDDNDTDPENDAVMEEDGVRVGVVDGELDSEGVSVLVGLTDDDSDRDGVTEGDSDRDGVNEGDVDILDDVDGDGVVDGLHVVSATVFSPAFAHKAMDDGLVVPWCSSIASTLLSSLVSRCASRPVNSSHMVFDTASTTVVAAVLTVGDPAGMFQRAISWPLRYTTPPSFAFSHRAMAGQMQS